MVFNSLSPICVHKISTDAVFIWREINEIRLSSMLNTGSPNPIVPDRRFQCIEFALLMTTVLVSVFWVEIELDECLEVSEVMGGSTWGRVRFDLETDSRLYLVFSSWRILMSVLWSLERVQRCVEVGCSFLHFAGIKQLCFVAKCSQWLS